MERWPDRVPPRPYWSRYCDGLDCVLQMTFEQILGVKGERGKIKGWAGNYNRIQVFTGGAAARFSEGGWASYRQVWPAVASGAASEAKGEPGSVVKFDVSDVDLTLPEIEVCPEPPRAQSLCSRSRDVVRSIGGRSGEFGKVYYHIKDPPEDKEELEALKEILKPYCNRAPSCTYYFMGSNKTVVATATSTEPGTPVTFHGPFASVTSTVMIQSDRQAYAEQIRAVIAATTSTVPDVLATSNSEGASVLQIEIIPVKYNWTELSQWATILDRFAHSRGNTIGITLAEVGSNNDGAEIEPVVWPLASLGPPGLLRDEDGNTAGYNPTEIRTTIVVVAIDAQRAADALPILLPQLGIPVDAVGLVVTSSRMEDDSGISVALGSVDSQDKAPLEPPSSNGGVPLPVTLGAGGAVILAVLGAAAFLAVRIRRRARGAPYT